MPHLMPTHERMFIRGNSPEKYKVFIDTTAYPVAPDGRVTSVAVTHRGCAVYFLGIRIRKAPNPLKERVIAVTKVGAPVAQLSLNDLSKLPTDADGYRQFTPGRNPHP
jgi:hypothetical protein